MTKKGHFSGKRRMPTLPTATKEQKVQKIRNAEYYDFQGVQDTLYTQSKENYWRPAEIASKGPARKANCGAKEKAITEFFQILYTEQ